MQIASVLRGFTNCLKLSAIILCASPFSASAQANKEPSKNRIWFTWEHRAIDPQLCNGKGHCDPISQYLTRMVEEPTTDAANQMVGSIDRLLTANGHPVEHPEAPRICQDVNPDAVLGFDPESWENSDKIEMLRGLQGVFVDAKRTSSMKGPVGYGEEFGNDVYEAIVKRFEKANIPLLSEEELQTTPGKPRLTFSFRLTCTAWGVSGSLKQTALLTRNHTIKLDTNTWSGSGGYQKDKPDQTEFDAMLIVIDKFIADFHEANPNGIVPRNQAGAPLSQADAASQAAGGVNQNGALWIPLD